MANPTLLAFTAPNISADATVPSGISGPGHLIVNVAHFYDSTSTASISGFASVRAAIPQTVATTLWLYYSDLSTISGGSLPITLSGSGGDSMSSVGAWSGIDSITPVPAGGTQTATNAGGGGTLSVAGATVDRTDSTVHLSCSAWDFNVWNASSPSGWTRDSGSSSSECGSYHSTALQAIGTSISASFSGSTGGNEEAVVLCIFQPAAGTSTSAPVLNGGHRQLRYSAIYRM